MTVAVDQRTSTWQLPIDKHAYVWIEDRSVKRVVRARLLSISSGGAVVRTYSLFPLDVTLHVGLEGSPEAGWIEAKAIRLERSRKVAITFMAPCPPEFILAATEEITS